MKGRRGGRGRKERRYIKREEEKGTTECFKEAGRKETESGEKITESRGKDDKRQSKADEEDGGGGTFPFDGKF